MAQIRYSHMQTDGYYAIFVDGVRVGTLEDLHDGRWKARLPEVRREAIASSLDAAKTWVQREVDA
jgi:hypothetical protein